MSHAGVSATCYSGCSIWMALFVAFGLGVDAQRQCANAGATDRTLAVEHVTRRWANQIAVGTLVQSALVHAERPINGRDCLVDVGIGMRIADDEGGRKHSASDQLLQE